MNSINFQLFILLSISFLIDSVFSGSRQFTSGTIYENEEYIDLFRVRNIQSFYSPGVNEEIIKFAFDNNFNNYWISKEEGTKVIDL